MRLSALGFNTSNLSQIGTQSLYITMRTILIKFLLVLMCRLNIKRVCQIKNIISLARPPEIGQGIGRILSCGGRKPEHTQMDL